MAILPEIYKNTDYFKSIKYLIVDDADEMPYAFWQFVDGIINNLEKQLFEKLQEREELLRQAYIK